MHLSIPEAVLCLSFMSVDGSLGLRVVDVSLSFRAQHPPALTLPSLSICARGTL